MIERLFAKDGMGMTHDQFMLIFDFLNDTLGSEFVAFLNHIKCVSEKFKHLLLEAGYDASI